MAASEGSIRCSSSNGSIVTYETGGMYESSSSWYSLESQCCLVTLSCDAVFGTEYELPACFNADSDVAGIGIVLSFVLTAILSFLMLSFVLFFIQDRIAPIATNRLDQIFSLTDSKIVQRYIGGANRIYIVRALEATSLMICDQQLFFSIGLLCVACAKHAELAQYHFEIIIDLAWLAATAYGTALATASGAIQMSGDSTMRKLRAIFATVKFVMLVLAQSISWNDYWMAVYGLPSDCVFADGQSGEYSKHLHLMILQLIVITWGYYWEMNILVLPDHFDYVTFLLTCAVLAPYTLHVRIRRSIDVGQPGFKKLALRVINTAIIPPAYVALIISELLPSTVFFGVRALAVIIWGILRIEELKSSANINGMSGSENQWGVGQIMPVLLLVIPIFTTADIFSEKRRESHSKTIANDDAPDDGKRDSSSTLSINQELNSDNDSMLTLKPDVEESETAPQQPTITRPLRARILAKLRERGRVRTLELLQPGTDDTETPDKKWIIDLYEDWDIDTLYENWIWRIGLVVTVLGVTVGAIWLAKEGYAF